MFLTLGQAAKEVGKSKSTILKSIKTGRLSAFQNDFKQWQIDPAELFRVYAPANDDNSLGNTQDNTSTLALQLDKEIQERERERRLLLSQIEDLKMDRDHWRNQATALLTNQSSETNHKTPETITGTIFKNVFKQWRK